MQGLVLEASVLSIEEKPALFVTCWRDAVVQRPKVAWARIFGASIQGVQYGARV